MKDTHDLRMKYQNMFHAFNHDATMELVKAHKEKGDSWKGKGFKRGNHVFRMDDYLRYKMELAHETYMEYNEPRQLLKLRNYAAMLWTRAQEAEK